MCCVTVSVVTCECVDLIVHYTAYPVTLTDLIPVKCHSARRTTHHVTFCRHFLAGAGIARVARPLLVS